MPSVVVARVSRHFGAWEVYVQDIIEENGEQVVRLLATGFGISRIVVFAHEAPEDLNGIARCGSSLLKLTNHLFFCG